MKWKSGSHQNNYKRQYVTNFIVLWSKDLFWSKKMFFLTEIILKEKKDWIRSEIKII